MRPGAPHPVVHLELQTPNLACACTFYTRLFGWSAENVHVGASSYLTLGLGRRLGGGVVESDVWRPFWLPYVEVADVTETVRQAEAAGAAVALEPAEGPAGWRSVVATPEAGEIAFWQQKR